MDDLERLILLPSLLRITAMRYHASLCSAGDRTQDFVHDGQVPCKLSYISRLSNLGIPQSSTGGQHRSRPETAHGVLQHEPQVLGSVENFQH